MERRIRAAVEVLCGEALAGRRPGTPGGAAARAWLREALGGLGLAVVEQPIPASGGANLLARVPAEAERWVVVGAHHDHLGQVGGQTFRGADDNAAAVAVLLEVARALVAEPPEGRGVLLHLYDAEEPPHFLGPGMGSEHWARHPDVPLERVDLMVCMDLVGHAFGPPGAPAALRELLFALGAERSEGTAAHVDRLASAEPGVWVRRLDAEVISPMSDYASFWSRGVPFLFLTGGRWRHYHTPEDTPDKLDYGRLEALARWLTRFVREACARPEPRLAFVPRRDDRATLETLRTLAENLPVPDAARAHALATQLLAYCGPDGEAPESVAHQARMLVAMLESALG